MRWNRGQEAELKKAVSSFLRLLHRRCELGIADDDRDIEINIGFCDGEALLLDPGRLSLNLQTQTLEGESREIEAPLNRLRRWLAEKHPSLLPFLEESVRRA